MNNSVVHLTIGNHYHTKLENKPTQIGIERDIIIFLFLKQQPPNSQHYDATLSTIK